MARWLRARLGDGGVRDAPRVHRRAQAARHQPGAGRRAHDRDPAADRPLPIYIDCDVLQADGGTRTASITGGMVALRLACERLIAEAKLERSPLTGSVAAISCGVVEGVPLLDLDYSEDSTAEVDANVVMTGDGGLVEVQATAERTPLSRAHLDELLAIAATGIEALRSLQDEAVLARTV